MVVVSVALARPALTLTAAGTAHHVGISPFKWPYRRHLGAYAALAQTPQYVQPFN